MNLRLARVLVALPFGQVTVDDVPGIVAHDALVPVLVRCWGCRFTCPIQDLERLISLVEAGGEYVRDVSVTVASLDAARVVVEQEDGRAAVEIAAKWSALMARQEVPL